MRLARGLCYGALPRRFPRYNMRMAMQPQFETRWNLAPRHAMRLEESLRERVESQDRFGEIRYVAGADVAFDPETEVAFAGVVVYRFPGLEEVERRRARRKVWCS